MITEIGWGLLFLVVDKSFSMFTIDFSRYLHPPTYPTSANGAYLTHSPILRLFHFHHRNCQALVLVAPFHGLTLQVEQFCSQ